MVVFPCTKCGCCCKHIDQVAAAYADIPELRFPHTFEPSGRCTHLTDSYLCDIYENRPTICRTDSALFKEKYFPELTTLQYYRKMAESCNFLMQLHGVDKSLNVKVD